MIDDNMQDNCTLSGNDLDPILMILGILKCTVEERKALLIIVALVVARWLGINDQRAHNMPGL